MNYRRLPVVEVEQATSHIHQDRALEGEMEVRSVFQQGIKTCF